MLVLGTASQDDLPGLAIPEECSAAAPIMLHHSGLCVAGGGGDAAGLPVTSVRDVQVMAIIVIHYRHPTLVDTSFNVT